MGSALSGRNQPGNRPDPIRLNLGEVLSVDFPKVPLDLADGEP
jgi:hypothetical protein